MLEEYETKGNISSSVDLYRDRSSREEEGDCTGIIQIGALDECNPSLSRNTSEPTCLEGATRKATPTVFQQQDLFQPGQARGEKDHFQKRSAVQILSLVLLLVGFVVTAGFLGVKMKEVSSLKEDLSRLELSKKSQSQKAESKFVEMKKWMDRKVYDAERRMKEGAERRKKENRLSVQKAYEKDVEMEQKLLEMQQKLDIAEKKVVDNEDVTDELLKHIDVLKE